MFYAICKYSKFIKCLYNLSIFFSYLLFLMINWKYCQFDIIILQKVSDSLYKMIYTEPLKSNAVSYKIIFGILKVLKFQGFFRKNISKFEFLIKIQQNFVENR